MWFPFVALLLPAFEVAGAHLADPDRLWSNGVVEYKFYRTFSLNLRTLVREAMDYITSVSPCITFVPANSSSVNYVLITPGARCSSELGMNGGQQFIYLNSACFDRGMIVPVHTLLHTLGFTHEHTRPDRDDFITLNEDNILPDLMNNFEKRPYGDSDFHTRDSVNHQNTPYDVLSVLHYGPLEFSKNGEAVINYRFGIPDHTFPEPTPDDPLSLIDKVELSLTFGCAEHLTNEKIIDYIHHNRLNNALRITSIEKRIEEEAQKMEEKNAKLAEENAKLAQQMQAIEKQIEKMIE